MGNQEGAEAYGEKYASGNISSEEMARLDERASKVDVSEEERQRFVENQTKSFGKRRWN